MNLKVCNKCGWIHFSISKKDVTEQVKEFGKFINSQDLPTRANFDYADRNWSFKEHFSQYTKCFMCGNGYKDFRAASEYDYSRSRGHTLQPILEYYNVT